MNRIKYFQRGGKNLPTAPDAKKAFKGGTYKDGLFKDEVIGSYDYPYVSRVISRKVNPITQDTTYRETPKYFVPEGDFIHVDSRKASSDDKDRTEYEILNRRFNEGASVVNDTITTLPKKTTRWIKPYLQQGGTMNQQQDIQQQVIQLVQAAMQGDQKATNTVNQIMQAAQQGDQQAVQLAQMIKQVVEQMKGQATMAKWGSKLGYIKSLKYAKGGKTCPSCQNGGKPLETPSVNKSLKKPIKKVEEKACGGKAKKYQNGDKFEDYYKFKRYGYQNDTLNLGPGYQVISQRFYPIYERLYEDPSYGIKRGSEVWFDSSTENGRNVYISPNTRDTVYFDTPSDYIAYKTGYMPVGKSENQKKSKEEFDKKYKDYESKKK